MNKLSRALIACALLLTFSVASLAGVTVTYLHTDAVGSVVAASDENGDLLWRKSYLPFGGKNVDGQAKIRAVGYTGHTQDDDTGLTYMKARSYDPDLGRFTQMDPAGVLDHAESNPMMFNRFAYANNNPYTFKDPDGWSPRRTDGAGAAAAGAVLGCLFRACGATSSAAIAATAAADGVFSLAGSAALNGGMSGEQFVDLVENVNDGNKKNNKRGPKTDQNAPHNKKIREIGDRIEAEGGTILAGGGRLPEKLVPTPGGRKAGRRPDILHKDCKGNTCAINVGKTKSDGAPIKREQEALDDLNGAGLPTTFEGYD